MCGRGAQTDDEDEIAQHEQVNAVQVQGGAGGGGGGAGGGGGGLIATTTTTSKSSSSSSSSSAAPTISSSSSSNPTTSSNPSPTKSTTTTKTGGYRPCANAAPGRNLPMIVMENGQRILKFAIWGLIPSSTSKKNTRSDLDFWKMSNARADNLPFLHRALVETKRCVIPLQGWYEWENRIELGKKVKQPYFVTSEKDGGYVMLAGIYDTWQSSDHEDEKPLCTFSIVTTDSSKPLTWLHDRMPVVLQNQDDINAWLDPTKPFNQVRHLLRSADSGLRWWPVTVEIGKLTYQDFNAKKPIDIAKARGGSSLDKFFTITKRIKVEGDNSSSSNNNSNSKDDDVVGGGSGT
jgi:putative SOS response-associated peptidase YedK